MFRKILFWIHLSAGVLSGLVVLMMSVTGVILTYERQILAWQEENAYFNEPANDQTRLPVEQLLTNGNDEEFTASSVAYYNDPASPAILRAGRSGSRYLNPYTGEILPPASETLDNFFSAVTGWHRWFNISGDGRGTARDITGAANLMFLFLVISGLYLWLPNIYNWNTMKLRLWFHPNAKTSAARDFNWHHVWGFWLAIPLAVVVATATVFNYSWANNLVYQLAGEEPPQRGGGGSGGNRGSEADSTIVQQLAYDDLMAVAATHLDDWRMLTMTIPAATAETVSFSIDQGNGGEPQKRHTLVLDARNGEVSAWQPFSSQSPGRQARSWVRFLHTGEALGLFGQTLAGLASFAGVILVWTGLALCYRRFRKWLKRTFRNSSSAQDEASSLNTVATDSQG
ncbi:MAG: PepSY domain-containing protein [Pseudomonadales bacterium]|nr:PepSY domain-containing protein [Pseudomonadales bacterium]